MKSISLDIYREREFLKDLWHCTVSIYQSINSYWISLKFWNLPVTCRRESRTRLSMSLTLAAPGDFEADLSRSWWLSSSVPLLKIPESEPDQPGSHEADLHQGVGSHGPGGRIQRKNILAVPIPVIKASKWKSKIFLVLPANLSASLSSSPCTRSRWRKSPPRRCWSHSACIARKMGRQQISRILFPPGHLKGQYWDSFFV